MGMPRHFRRRSAMRPVIQSYKMVIDYAPASQPIAKLDFPLSQGIDSVPAGQTGPGAVLVPTGSAIRYIEIKYAVVNLASTAAFLYTSIQRLHSGQTSIDPRVVGGDTQRNQVHLQLLRSIGEQQNNTLTIRFKIPAKFQRVRDGDIWQLVTYCTGVTSQAVQVNYKFYR